MNLRSRFFLVCGAVSGLLSVAMGAFGAHCLPETKLPRLVEVFHTGAQYQMYHALALIAVAWVMRQSGGGRAAAAAGWAFVIGTILFSGSLYLLTLTEIRKLGMITPFGGVSFMVGWGLLAVAAWRDRPDASLL